MLSKKKRVNKEVFQTLMKEGKPFVAQLFLFYSKKTPDSHFAFVAPKAIFKTAVKRNKFRRIGYNILRSIQTKPVTGIFIYKKQAISANKEEIKDDVVFILKKLNLI